MRRDPYPKTGPRRLVVSERALDLYAPLNHARTAGGGFTLSNPFVDTAKEGAPGSRWGSPAAAEFFALSSAESVCHGVHAVGVHS